MSMGENVISKNPNLQMVQLERGSTGRGQISVVNCVSHYIRNHWIFEN